MRVLPSGGGGRGGVADYFFIFPLPGFDFGTSLICSVLTYYHSW